MYKLLDKPPSVSLQVIRNNNYTKNISRQNANVDKVILHYRTDIKNLKSSHFLVNILNTIPTGEGMSNYRYRFLIEDMVDEIANAFHLSSSGVLGKSMFPSPFHGRNVEEIIILTQEPFDTVNIEQRWKDLSPIRFLSHPSVNLNAPLPNDSDGADSGHAVTTINLPMLALQYKLWREHTAGMEYRQTVMQFVNSFPIPNSIRSYHRVAIFNILTGLFSGEEIRDYSTPHPFYLNTYRDKLIDSMGSLLRDYQERRISFLELISVFELDIDTTVLDVCSPPKIQMTKQVKWAVSLGRMKLFSFFVLWNARGNTVGGRRTSSALKRLLGQLSSDKSLNSIGSRTLTRNVEEYLKEEIKAFL